MEGGIEGVRLILGQHAGDAACALRSDHFDGDRCSDLSVGMGIGALGPLEQGLEAIHGDGCSLRLDIAAQ